MGRTILYSILVESSLFIYFFTFFTLFYPQFFPPFSLFFKVNMATGVKAGKLAATKKFDAYVKSGDLYSLPVTAVPGCGFLLGILLKRDGITRASELYDLYKAQKKGFAKSLACKFGNWNLVYVNTVIKAFEDWEALHVVKPEKKVKAKAKEEKKKGPPRKVGPGSKKWEEFLKRTDLSKTPVTQVPGVASTLGCELKKIGKCTAGQLMDQYKGNKNGQCNGDDEKFHKWILCSFGYWNTQYSKAVLSALKAYDAKTVPPPLVVPVEPKTEPTEDNENQGESFKEMVTRVAESAADAVGEAMKPEERFFVSVGGEQIALVDVDDGVVARMTQNEKDAWIQLTQRIYGE